jgi:hypothetical protein
MNLCNYCIPDQPRLSAHPTIFSLSYCSSHYLIFAHPATATTATIINVKPTTLHHVGREAVQIQKQGRDAIKEVGRRRPCQTCNMPRKTSEKQRFGRWQSLGMLILCGKL